MVKQISEKSSFRGPFDKQHGKRDKILLKLQRHYLCDIYWSLWKQFSWKESLIVICKTLGHFANTLNVGHISSLLNKDKLSQPIQMQLSQKQKDFSQFLASFSKSRLNFQHFQKQDDPHRWCISDITDSKKHGEMNVWKFTFQTTLSQARL